MSKSTIRPDDKRNYEKVKGAMKKKGKGAGGDPKAFKSFKKKVADLEKRQADKRRSALDKLFKRAESWLKLCQKVKEESRLTKEKKFELIEKIISDMMDNLVMTPAMKSALDPKDFEKEVRKAIGALPNDDQNAAAGHVDAIVRKIEDERKKTQTLVDGTVKAISKINKAIAAGQMPDPVMVVIALMGLIAMLKKGRDKK